MNQYSAIREVRRLLRAVMEQSQRPELIEQLEEIDVRLKAFHDRGIDFKEVVDGLDDSIMITDAEGTVLYINPAYTRNTEITEEDVLNRDVRSLIGKDKLFTGGAVTSVLESGKSAFRLSTTYKTGEPLVGYVVGTPIFKEDGSLRQVVACSRPIVTLSSLQEDFEAFVKEINAIHPKTITTDSDKHLSEGMIGKYGSLKQIDTLLDRVAPTDASVLITGESGTGKELVARAIHFSSPRSQEPFVSVNCMALNPGVLESELFGHEKGSFTGAVAMRRGRFEQASGGTLFLDEVGELTPELQVKLLRVLQERRFERVGGSEEIEVDIRIVAATNKDLMPLVQAGTFREDLYYRLNVVHIPIPPLRERREDIPLLVAHFAEKAAKENGIPPKTFSTEALNHLSGYEWPGNIRQLQNVVERCLVLVPGDVITLEDLPAEIRDEEAQFKSAVDLLPVQLDLADTLERIDAALIRRALVRADFVQAKAAELLGISKSLMQYKLKKYSITGH